MQHRINSAVPTRAARAVCLGVFALLLPCAACQSAAPTASREPAAAAPPAANALPEPTTVKLAANAPAAAALAPATQAAAAVALADAPSAKKGDKAAAPAGKETQGTAVTEEAFSTWLQTTSPAQAGGPVQLEAVLVAKPPYHCNPEYPHKFKLNAAPAGLSYPEETVRGMKVTPGRSVLAIPVHAQSAGKPTITGTLSFSVCTEERCMVEKRDLSVALDVM